MDSGLAVGTSARMALACGQKRPHLLQAELCRQTSKRFLAADASQKSLAGWDLQKAGARRKLQL